MPLIRDGDPKREILDAARELDADLIVTGARGAGFKSLCSAACRVASARQRPARRSSSLSDGQVAPELSGNRALPPGSPRRPGNDPFEKERPGDGREDDRDEDGAEEVGIEEPARQPQGRHHDPDLAARDHPDPDSERGPPTQAARPEQPADDLGGDAGDGERQRETMTEGSPSADRSTDAPVSAKKNGVKIWARGRISCSTLRARRSRPRSARP